MEQITNGKKILIIGGVAAGATAAARARRLDATAEITIVEKGRYVSFANCGLPYFISRDIPKRSALILQTPEGFFSRYRVTVLLETEALSLDRAARKVRVRGPEGESDLTYDSLILAQGGTPVFPSIRGLDSPNVFKLWTIPDMDAVHKFVETEKPSSAVVIGGGFIGLEAAEAFLKRGLATSIVELTETLMPPADPEFGMLIRRSYEAAGARVFTGRSVRSVDVSSRTVLLDDGSEVPAGIVLVSAGVRPNTELAKAAGLEIGSSGGVSVDEGLRTGDPHIWAAGDMVEIAHRVGGRRVRIPLAGPANRQGRIAATNALGGSLTYRGALGSSVFKSMEETFAMTGLSEKAASAAGFDVGTSTVSKAHHVTYYPGYEDLFLKLVFDRADGRLLGGQAYGREGADKRIDALATALAGGLTVDDLAELDLAYAPPYNSANDPINMAAYAAQNDLSGYSPARSARQAADALGQGEVLLVDVRTYGEYAKGSVQASLHLPVDELRDRLDELPKDRDILLLSKAGFESHIALRQLRQRGFERVWNISGGMAALSLQPGLRWAE